MNDPARAERPWLAIALATWWLLAVGGEAEAAIPAETWPPLPSAVRSRLRHPRLMSVFRQGWNRLLAALFTQQPLPTGHGQPEPWAIPPPLSLMPDSASLPNPSKNLNL